MVWEQNNFHLRRSTLIGLQLKDMGEHFLIYKSPSRVVELGIIAFTFHLVSYDFGGTFYNREYIYYVLGLNSVLVRTAR